MQISLVVVAVAAALMYYIGREVLGTFRHPADEELVDFWSGRLRQERPRAYRRVSEHLASCSACRQRLDEIRKDNAGPGADSPLIERKY